jgi:hypothetical protein
VDKDITFISAKIMAIIWPDGKRAHLLDLDKTIEYTECDDTFALCFPDVSKSLLLIKYWL